jgi:nucleoside-diphosphate-sugar epimerase
MRILVLGGTVFLGRHFVEAAIERGHRVTLFNRGRASAVACAQVEQVAGDRTGSLAELTSRRWDAVLDTSGYLPRVVRASADALASTVELYAFVSSISAYANFVPGIEESAPVAEPPAGKEEELTVDNYGPLKALCEDEVQSALRDRALIVRPGLIVGPRDPTERFTYWVRRVARGGEILAPGEPNRPVQLIDVRDLANWVVRALEDGVTGVFNATGPEPPLTFGAMLDGLLCGTKSQPRFTWLPDDFLLEHKVEPFSDLPLWLTAEDAAGFFGVDSSRAISRGLRFRSLSETARDTLAWDHGAKNPIRLPEQYDVGSRTAGLEPEREAELLRAFADR